MASAKYTQSKFKETVRSTKPWGWIWETSPGALSLVFEEQGPLTRLTLHLIMSWSTPSPWRTALCLLTAHPALFLPDSWRGNDFKEKMIKENPKEVWWKEKECQTQQSSGGAVPAGQASYLHCVKARPVQPSRRLCLEDKGPEFSLWKTKVQKGK